MLQHDEEVTLDYTTLNQFRNLKKQYKDIIQSSQDKKLVATTKLQLKLLERKFKNMIR